VCKDIRKCILLYQQVHLSVGLPVLQFLDSIEEIREDIERINSKVGGWHNLHQIFDFHYTRCKNNGSHEVADCIVPWEKIK
jgi:hypothetical protein